MSAMDNTVHSSDSSDAKPKKAAKQGAKPGGATAAGATVGKGKGSKVAKVDVPAVEAAERKRRLEQIRKSTKASSAAATPRHAAALGEQIEQSELGQEPQKKKKKKAQAETESSKRRKLAADDDDADPVTDYIEQDISEKILQRARMQLSEEERRTAADAEADQGWSRGGRSSASRSSGGVSDDEDEHVADQAAAEPDDFEDEQTEAAYERAAAELEQSITADDEAALALFMHSGAADGPMPRLTLADIIMDKIREREQSLLPDASLEQTLAQRLDPKVVQVFKGVGKLLAVYSSGPLPKAFKIIPALSNWEEVLWLTEPPSWTPAAAAAATRIFASNLNAKMAQRFYNLVLLPMVRQDIKQHHRLNFHLYLAMKKALFKSSAFYRGVLLPLAESGQCTLREATIVASVVGHVSVPVLDSSVAILKLAQMPYSGANSVFLRTLLNKKYALPYRVVHAVVAHFVSFRNESRQLPLLWHQSLLVFVQRYKNDLLPSEREALLTLLRHQSHPLLVEDCRRELLSGVVREAPAGSGMEV